MRGSPQGLRRGLQRGWRKIGGKEDWEVEKVKGRGGGGRGGH
jgi:hypothetical protein